MHIRQVEKHWFPIGVSRPLALVRSFGSQVNSGSSQSIPQNADHTLVVLRDRSVHLMTDMERTRHLVEHKSRIEGAFCHTVRAVNIEAIELAFVQEPGDFDLLFSSAANLASLRSGD